MGSIPGGGLSGINPWWWTIWDRFLVVDYLGSIPGGGLSGIDPWWWTIRDRSQLVDYLGWNM